MNLHDALEEIRQRVGRSATKSYTRGGCKVSMANLRSKPANRVVLDVDLAFPTGRAKTNQCDLILFHIDDSHNRLVGALMELKRGSIDASEAFNQLQGGARIVDSVVPKNIEIELVFVLVHGKGNHKAQLRRLNTSRIAFRGEELPINTARCGHQGNLAQALAKSTKR